MPLCVCYILQQIQYMFQHLHFSGLKIVIDSNLLTFMMMNVEA